MTKQQILAAIRSAAEQNDGAAPGMRTFARLTGLDPSAWLGKYWRSWGAALQEAGFAPNSLSQRMPDEDLLRSYCLLARELGRFPAKNDLRLKKRRDSTFPSPVAITRRFGSYPAARAAAHTYSLEHPDFGDVTALLAGTRPARGADELGPHTGLVVTGFVYMIKHGSRAEYKIGKTINPLRREGEMRLQLPEKLKPVHYIATDDPAGVESYWHARFAEKRKEGEWFALGRDDVAAFRRWRRIL